MLEAPETGSSGSRDGRPRVVHVAEALGGGVLEMVRVTCEGNLADGMAVTVVHGRRPETPYGAPFHDTLPGVEIVELGRWGARTVASEIGAARTIRRLVQQRRADVVVFHSSFAGMVGALLPMDCPTVFVPHAFASRVVHGAGPRLLLECAERFACAAHTATVCVSHSEARVARALGARRVVTIANGIHELDAPHWPPDPEPPARHKVVAGGRLVPQRRPIEAAALLQQVRDLADVEWIGGAGSSEYAAEAAGRLAAAGVTVTGWLDREAALDRMRTASVYLHWASWDGLSIALLEALACNTVVVAADTEPNREVLGLQGTCRSVDDAVRRIRMLLTDDDVWRAQVLHQREIARPYGARSSQAAWNRLLRDVSGVAAPVPGAVHVVPT